MLWPRPAVCASRPGARHHQATRLLDGDRRIKLVNAARAIEFRPVLKAGSTFFAELLPCLQPGEWTRVHQREPMPAGYTALIAVREPLERFASALVEVLRRVFRGRCPEGACEAGRDAFSFADDPDGFLDKHLQTTTWLAPALRLFLSAASSSPAVGGLHRGLPVAGEETKGEDTKGEARRTADRSTDKSTEDDHGMKPAGSAQDSALGASHDRTREIHQLLEAAIMDATCSVKYYASEHFMTQSALMLQGAGDVPPEPEAAELMPLESLGKTAESISASTLLDRIGGRDVPAERLQECVRVAQEKSAARVNMTGTETDAAFDALPTELEIVQMLNEDHSLTLPLCVMYVQDFKCLAEHYSMPAPCAALLQAVASGEEKSTLRSTDSPCSE